MAFNPQSMSQALLGGQLGGGQFGGGAFTGGVLGGADFNQLPQADIVKQSPQIQLAQLLLGQKAADKGLPDLFNLLKSL